MKNHVNTEIEESPENNDGADGDGEGDFENHVKSLRDILNEHSHLLENVLKRIDSIATVRDEIIARLDGLNARP